MSNLVNDAGYITSAPPAPVQSVAGKTGNVTLTKADVGLGNVDNTSDANKPVSTPTQAALDLKADLTAGNLTQAHRESWSKKLGGVQWIDEPDPLGDPYNLSQATPRYVVVGMPDDSDVCEIEFFESDFFNQQVITIANVGKGTVKLVGDTKAVLLPGDTLTFTQLDDILYTIEHHVSPQSRQTSVLSSPKNEYIAPELFGRSQTTLIYDLRDTTSSMQLNIYIDYESRIPMGASLDFIIIGGSGQGTTQVLFSLANYMFLPNYNQTKSFTVDSGDIWTIRVARPGYDTMSIFDQHQSQ